MTTERGEAKQNCRRAKMAVGRALGNVIGLPDQYHDYEGFAELAKLICVNLDECESALGVLETKVP